MIVTHIMSVVPAVNTKVLLDTAAEHLKISIVIALKVHFARWILAFHPLRVESIRPINPIDRLAIRPALYLNVLASAMPAAYFYFWEVGGRIP